MKHGHDILRFSELDSADQQVVESIFFSNSIVKEFKNTESKTSFKYKYFSYYINCPEALFSVAISSRDSKVSAYICGVLDIRNHPHLLQLRPYLTQFQLDFNLFPAELHINVSADYQGHGLGGHLLDSSIAKLKRCGVLGVHVITNSNDSNIKFYQKNNFKIINSYSSAIGKSLTFMGMRII